jgi:diguanylate cyclase (GGDEF)-like protein
MPVLRIFRMFCLAAIAATLTLAPARAATGSASDTLALFERACLIPSERPLALETVARSGEWDCRRDFRTAKASNLWLRADLSDLPPGKYALAGMASPFDSLQIAVVGDDGTMTSRRYAESEVRDAWTPANNYALPLDFGEGPWREIYVGITGSQTHLMATELALKPYSLAHRQRLTGSVAYALCVGMLLLVVVLSGAMARMIRSRLALRHSLFTLLVAIYVLSSSSLIFLVWPGLDLWWRIFINYASLALSFAMLGPIVLDYLGRETVPQALRIAVHFGVGVLVAAVAVIPLRLVIEFDSRMIYHLLYVPGTIALLACVAHAIVRRNPSVRNFVLAWSAPLIFGIERVLRGSELYYLPTAFDHLFYFGLAIQGIVMTIAIASQAERLRRERDLERINASTARASALTDALTGLPNRRDFEEFDWSRAQFLGVFDLDRFKAINDTHGHVTGDETLKAIAGTLSDQGSDGVIRAWRMGGEEFALAVDEPTIEQAAIVINRIRARLTASVASQVPGLSVPVTVSAGVAPVGAGLRQTYRAADAALYRAKAAGRDKLCFECGDGELTTLFAAQPIAAKVA